MRKGLLEDADLTEHPRYWTNGRFSVSTTVSPWGERRGSGRNPMSVTLSFRTGDDRAYTGYDLTWADVEHLHARLGDILVDRARFEKAVKRAKERARR